MGVTRLTRDGTFRPVGNQLDKPEDHIASRNTQNTILKPKTIVDLLNQPLEKKYQSPKWQTQMPKPCRSTLNPKPI